MTRGSVITIIIIIMRNKSLITLFAMLFVTASLVNLVALSYDNNLVASIAKPFLMRCHGTSFPQASFRPLPSEPSATYS